MLLQFEKAQLMRGPKTRPDYLIWAIKCDGWMLFIPDQGWNGVIEIVQP